MRDYELVFIVDPDLDEKAYEELCNRVKGWIKELGATLVREDHWGKRRMAYPINKQRDGHYMLYVLQMEPSAVAELERNLRILESVMRFLVIKTGEEA